LNIFKVSGKQALLQQREKTIQKDAHLTLCQIAQSKAFAKCPTRLIEKERRKFREAPIIGLAVSWPRQSRSTLK
jgi:hypothetical protein